MKKYIYLFVFLFVASPLRAMQDLSVREEERAAELLFWPDLRLTIVQFLLRSASVTDALIFLKALSCVNKESWQLFKGKENAMYFMTALHNFSYTNDFDLTLSTVKELAPLIEGETVRNYIQAFEEREALHHCIKECSLKGEWNTVQAKCTETLLAKNPVWSSVLNCHWESDAWYRNEVTRQAGPAKTTLINQALCLGAPCELIRLLMEQGALAKKLHRRTPSPFLILCDRIIKCHKALQRNPWDLDLEALVKGDEASLKDYPELGNLLKLFVESDSESLLINNSFCIVDSEELRHYRYVFPLGVAARGQYIKMISWLLSKGAKVTSAESFEQAMQGVFQGLNEHILETIRALLHANPDEAVLKEAFSALLCFENGLAIETEMQNHIVPHSLYRKKEFRVRLLELFLEVIKNSINDPLEGDKTLLEEAQVYGNNEAEVLLRARGAVDRDEKKKKTVFLGEKISHFVHMNAYRSCEEDYLLQEARNLFSYLIEHIDNVVSDFAFAGPLVAFAVDYSRLPEAQELLKTFLACEPLSLEFLGCETLPTVLHMFVNVLENAKNCRAAAQCRIISLISLLALEEGYANSLLQGNNEGKTAHQKALDAGLIKLASAISCPPPVDNSSFWDERVNSAQGAGFPEKTKEVLNEALQGLMSGEALVGDMGKVLLLAFLKPSYEESKEFLKYAALCEPFVLRGSHLYEDVSSVFHFLIRLLDIFFSSGNEAICDVLLSQAGLQLVSSLVAEGVTDTHLLEGKTAAQMAQERGIVPLVECITKPASADK